MYLNLCNRVLLKSPCTFQGAKTRIADTIVDYILSYLIEDRCNMFYDLCCGSGTISLELLKNGVSPESITMIDCSSFGGFWESVSNNSFDTNRFLRYIDSIPNDLSFVQGFLKKLSDRDVDEDEVYIYLLLQAGSFGSKQIGVKDGRYTNCSFRRYWLPTETSNRRSPVNPMMPLPYELYKRVYNIVSSLAGHINAKRVDLNTYRDFNEFSVCYIDPPYKGTTGYMYSLDYEGLIKYLVNDKFCTVILSETDGISNNLKDICKSSICLSTGRNKGGISGNRTVSPYSEWIYIFEPDIY